MTHCSPLNKLCLQVEVSVPVFISAILALYLIGIRVIPEFAESHRTTGNQNKCHDALVCVCVFSLTLQHVQID